MGSEFTREVVTTFLFYQLSFLEFDVNVFKAILSIETFFKLTEYREVIIKNLLLIMHQECRFKFDSGCSNVNGFILQIVVSLRKSMAVRLIWLDRKRYSTHSLIIISFFPLLNPF